MYIRVSLNLLAVLSGENGSAFRPKGYMEGSLTTGINIECSHTHTERKVSERERERKRSYKEREESEEEREARERERKSQAINT